jgi:hypothetical protein
VGEHLPCYRAETFVAHLVGFRHGYALCDLAHDRVWGEKRVGFWSSEELIIFCKQEMTNVLIPTEVIAAARPLSFPHRLTFVLNATRYCPPSHASKGLVMEKRGTCQGISTRNPIPLDCRQRAPS